MATIKPKNPDAEYYDDSDNATAIIYSIDDLGSYIVEIHYHGNKFYVGSKNNPRQFLNLADAKEAALKNRATVTFLALSKTYEQMDMHASYIKESAQRFDYIRI